jgi:hypothetical protein
MLYKGILSKLSAAKELMREFLEREKRKQVGGLTDRGGEEVHVRGILHCVCGSTGIRGWQQLGILPALLGADAVYVSQREHDRTTPCWAFGRH